MDSNTFQDAEREGFKRKSCMLTGPLPAHRELVVQSIDGNWVKGTFQGYKFAAKIFANASEWGIDGGRISQLQIFACKDGVWLQEPEEPRLGSRLRRYPLIFSYDRGATEGTSLGTKLAAEFAGLFSKR